MRRLPLALAALLVTSLGLAGCGGDDSKQAAAPEPTVAFTADGGDEEQVEPTTWPLTGLPVADGDSAVEKHPILVTKIDNTSSSSPRSGSARPIWSWRSSSRVG